MASLDYKSIRAGSFYANGSYQSLDYRFEGSNLIIKNQLPINQPVQLEFYTGNQILQVTIDTVEIGALYDGTYVTNGGARVVRIPANPDKGFNFDFLIAVDAQGDISASNDKKHIFLEMINIGTSKSKADFEDSLDYNKVLGSSYMAYKIAFDLEMPVVYPLIPRLHHSIDTQTTGRASFYMHALDRDSIYYKEIASGDMYGDSVGNQLISQIIDSGYEIHDFDNIDEQILSMVDYARDYLADNGVQTQEKVFISGYSASGSFSERFTALHPSRVRASAAGGSGDDFIMPVDKINNKDLIYPIGTSDYEDITGRAFSMTDYNQVAKVVYMGKDDTNNVVPYSDCYGDDERRIITELWGLEILPRALAMFEDYQATQGQSLFILDQGVGHGSSQEIKEYLTGFFRSNIGDDTLPVYPQVKATNLEDFLYLD